MDNRLIVRGEDGVRSFLVDDWTSYVAIACLSAEPETLGELADALRRYQVDPDWARAGDPLPAIPFSELDTASVPWCLMDLIGRTLVAGGEFELPDCRAIYRSGSGGEEEESERAQGNDARTGARSRGAEGHEGSHASHVSQRVDSPRIWMHIPNRWRFETVSSEDSERSSIAAAPPSTGAPWMHRVEERAETRRAVPRVDAHAILFGMPLLRHIAEGVLASRDELRRDDGGPETETEYKRIRGLHVDWMMTPREDLVGRTPRQVLLDQYEYIQQEIEFRAHQWTREGRPPHPLSVDSIAYRFGAFGLPEIVIYYDYVRHLLSEACEIVRDDPDMEPTRLIARLERLGEQWIDEPLPDERDLSARTVLEATRKRLPVPSDPGTIDDDCPICRAERDGMFGPSFLMFDGHHLELEGEFAFSLLDEGDWRSSQESYRGWKLESQPRNAGDAAEEEEEEESEEDHTHDADPTAHRDVRDRPDAFGSAIGTGHGSESDEESRFESVWTSTYRGSNQSIGNEGSPEFNRMLLSFPLAEIVGFLKNQADGRAHVDAINTAFDAFRRSANETDARQSVAALRDRLEHAARAYPDLVGRSADFQSQIDEVVRAARV
ncbi:MAG: hypothetical protein FJ297_18690 [Planctomycetes bacterium]|nr:hypothetical protein [Planctomycetota bacterium]